MRKILLSKYFYLILFALLTMLTGSFMLFNNVSNQKDTARAGGYGVKIWVRSFLSNVYQQDDSNGTYGVVYNSSLANGHGGNLKVGLDSHRYSNEGGSVSITIELTGSDSAKPNISYANDEDSLATASYSSTSWSGDVNFKYIIQAQPNTGFIVSNIISCDSSTPEIAANSNLAISHDGSISNTYSHTGSYNVFQTKNSNLYFYVVFAPRFETITLDADGGSLGDNSNKVVLAFYTPLTATDTAGTTYINYVDLPIPTRTGYSFTGWGYSSTTLYRYPSSYDNAPNGYWCNYMVGVVTYGEYILQNVYFYYFTATSPITLTARWKADNYYVSYNSNGGSGTMATQTISYDVPTALTKNSFTRTGHYFDGWLSSSTATTREYIDGQVVTNIASGGETKTLYAKWLVESYNIIFDANGGSSSISRLDNVSYGTSATLPTPTREGYYFTGWKYGATKYSAGSLTVPDFGANGASVTFVAQWATEQYRVTFDANGGTVKTTSALYTFGSSYTLPTATLSGYNFIGWRCDNTGNTYSGTVTMPDLTPGVAGSLASVTFVAEWEPVGYYIRFNANGGSGTMANQPMTYNSSASLTSNSFTRAGYLFKGWNTSAAGTTAQYTNGQSVSNLSTVDGGVFDLYAVWGDTWANHTATPSGRGTLTSPYLIATPQNLAWMSAYCEKTGNLSGYFIQTASLDMSAYQWLPIGNSTRYFLGSYDGQGYAITGLKVSTATGVESSYQGLFGYVGGTASAPATLKNIRLMDGSVTGTDYVGGIVGIIYNSNVENCTNMIAITGANYIGGIIGRAGTGTANVKISGCYNYGDVSGANYVGGVIGYCTDGTTINACYAGGKVTAGTSATNYAGGIIGCASGGRITNCAYEGVIAGGTGCGAIIGYANSAVSITDCYAKATVPSVTYNYGLGSPNATISNCVFEINSTKRFKGTAFTNWVLTVNNKPLPSGLTWLATGGTPISSTSQLTAAGYTKVS